MFKSIKITLAIAAYYDYEVWQMDVKFAFFNVYHEEEFYITQPESFVSNHNPNLVYKLYNKCLNWNKHWGVGICALMQ